MLTQIRTDIFHKDWEAQERADALAELGYNVKLEQINLITWAVTYWTVLGD